MPVKTLTILCIGDVFGEPGRRALVTFLPQVKNELQVDLVVANVENAAAGFGVATLIPAAMHAADQLPGLRPGTGLMVVSWLLRVGSISSPPLVGLVADATSLRIGLIVVPVAGVAAMLLAVRRTSPEGNPRKRQRHWSAVRSLRYSVASWVTHFTVQALNPDG